MERRPLLTATLLIGTFLSCVPAPQDDLAAWIQQLHREADDAEPELVRKIAKVQSREAMEGLLAAYDKMASVYMRREIVKALSRYDEVKDAAQPALEKITNVAVSAKHPELRETAIEQLGRCNSFGQHFLRQIVDSRADDGVRVMAMEEHVKRAAASDDDWYRYIWNPEKERRKDPDGFVIGELEQVREFAFGGLAPRLNDDELVDTIREDLNFKIRRAALRELSRRKSAKAGEMAQWVFERVDVPGPNRAEAAQILADIEGPKVVKDFLKMAKKRDVTHDDLRNTMAEILVSMDDPDTNKLLAKLIGRGKPHEKIFALRVTSHIDDEKLTKRIRTGLKDKSVEVRRATAIALAKRGDRESVELFEKMLERPRDPADQRIAIDALGAVRTTERQWLKKLAELCTLEDRDARNAAVSQLGEAQREEYIPTIVEALGHADWTTRLVAIRALEEWRPMAAVPALIKRLPEETGRMKRTVADALWSLTGKPFNEDSNRWNAWWNAEGAEFRVIDEDDLAAAEKARELQRLKQRTSTDAEFFGIRINSQRVIFIIDTSGSMTAPVYGRRIDNRDANRIEVAKQELRKCIEALETNALFNIYAFSSGIGRWIESGISGASEHARSEALEWVDRLGAGGATNLFDTVKMAFDDPDVDTIFILSDGEPTSGEIIDPARIREEVKFWNEHRQIKIHTIAIGGELEVLEWIAEDAGGNHVRIR